MKVVWTARAREDRRRVFRYLLERNPAAASRVVEAMIVMADSLSTFPERGRPGKIPDTRELAAVRPYLMVYRVDHRFSVVRILRVWHGAQDR